MRDPLLHELLVQFLFGSPLSHVLSVRHLFVGHGLHYIQLSLHFVTGLSVRLCSQYLTTNINRTASGAWRHCQSDFGSKSSLAVVLNI